MEKMLFTARLDPDLIDRLRACAKARHTSYNYIISSALDALDREQHTEGSLLERVAFLEKNLAALLDLVMTFSEKLDEKFSQANTNEKERLKSLYKLLDVKMTEHDEAEEARFYRFAVGRKEGNS